jgi:hypothetical protein
MIPDPSTIGLPGIKPHPGVADPMVPAFTAQDVTRYFATIPNYGRFDSSTPTSVIDVQFLTAQQAEATLRTTLAPTPADRLVCVVKIDGTFISTGPPGARPTTSATALIVFDAHTGNILVSGLG